MVCPQGSATMCLAAASGNEMFRAVMADNKNRFLLTC